MPQEAPKVATSGAGAGAQPPAPAVLTPAVDADDEGTGAWLPFAGVGLLLGATVVVVRTLRK